MKNEANDLDNVTFDSEPIIAFYLAEVGGEIVRNTLKRIQNGEILGYLNIVNLSKIYYILSRISPEAVEEKQKNLRLYNLKIMACGRKRQNSGVNTHFLLEMPLQRPLLKASKPNWVVGNDEEFNSLGVELLRIR